MIFTALPLPGAYAIEPEPATDERGFFARLWCAREFAANGLPLYLFLNDRKPGDVNGQGVEKTWYAISPSGRIIKAKPVTGTSG